MDHCHRPLVAECGNNRTHSSLIFRTQVLLTRGIEGNIDVLMSTTIQTGKCVVWHVEQWRLQHIKVRE